MKSHLKKLVLLVVLSLAAHTLLCQPRITRTLNSQSPGQYVKPASRTGRALAMNRDSRPGSKVTVGLNTVIIRNNISPGTCATKGRLL